MFDPDAYKTEALRSENTQLQRRIAELELESQQRLHATIDLLAQNATLKEALQTACRTLRLCEYGNSAGNWAVQIATFLEQALAKGKGL